MALSISSLTTSFASLSLPSSASASASASASKTQLLSFRAAAARRNLRLVVTAAASGAGATAADAAAAAACVASPTAEELGGMSLEKYVKSRLPGGIATQRIIGTGRRKTAIARVVLQEGTGKVLINYRDGKEYLQGNPLWLQYVKTPLTTVGFEHTYDIFVKVHGGGLSGQAQAICLGVARALLKLSENNRAPLRQEGLLTRDPRIVERKKAGLKKARKRPQYSKR